MVQAELNCLHQHYLTNQIHKLIIQNASKNAVDDALKHLKKILDEHPKGDLLKLFIDARLGVPPLQYFFSEIRKLYANYDHLPEIRVVYLYNDSIVLSVLQVFLNTLGLNATRRFSKGGSEIEAQNWLLSNEA